MVIAPLQLGLAIQMHHHFGSRFLIDSLHQHGFCSSYDKVQTFERNASVTQQNVVTVTEGQFVQYAADNVDHNIQTLDGYGTFHGMGMVAILTPGKCVTHVIPRHKVTTNEILRSRQVTIHYYHHHKDNLYKFGEFAHLKP